MSILAVYDRNKTSLALVLIYELQQIYQFQCSIFQNFGIFLFFVLLTLCIQIGIGNKKARKSHELLFRQRVRQA